MKPKILLVIKVLIVPTLYAVILRLFFGVKDWESLFSVMSLSFLLLLPFIVGTLSVYFSDDVKAESALYKIFIPWIPVFLFLIITLILAWEGWACWLMVLPLFLVAASLGGIFGGYLKSRKKQSKMHISLLLLFPFFLSPLEQSIGSIPGTYRAYTYIDIESSPEKIWENVTRVKGITTAQDKGWLTKLLGFPRPVKAELNYEGVGAYRKAEFTNGLLFHETVTEYEHQKKMVFTIRANPHEIPSTTLDQHVVVGGQFFDVLNGSYELEKLKKGKYRLHLYSFFKMNTTFNFYASWWARWIMQDIQNNILQVEKQRAEQVN